MPYVNANNTVFELIDPPFPPGFIPFWPQGITFYKEDDDIISAQPGFNSFELVQARLRANNGQLLLKIGLDDNGVRMFGEGYFGNPSCPPLDEKRGLLVPDEQLPNLIPPG